MNILQGHIILCCTITKGNLNTGHIPALVDFAYLGYDKRVLRIEDYFVQKNVLQYTFERFYNMLLVKQTFIHFRLVVHFSR